MCKREHTQTHAHNGRMWCNNKKYNVINNMTTNVEKEKKNRTFYVGHCERIQSTWIIILLLVIFFTHCRRHLLLLLLYFFPVLSSRSAQRQRWHKITRIIIKILADISVTPAQAALCSGRSSISTDHIIVIIRIIYVVSGGRFSFYFFAFIFFNCIIFRRH